MGPDELSTHIAKLPSGNLTHLLELEYQTTRAVRALLSDDDVVDMRIVHLPSIREDALVIPRFDRMPTGKRIHFEEFNQLLGKYSGDDKHGGTYEDMGQFILRTPACIPAEADRLLRRIFASLPVGNTDAHFKNFAMFHTRDGLRLTPSYDLVAASPYPEFQSVALRMGWTGDLAIGSLPTKHLAGLTTGFGMNEDALASAVVQLGKRLPKALEAIEGSDVGPRKLRNSLQKKKCRNDGTAASHLLAGYRRRGKAKAQKPKTDAAAPGGPRGRQHADDLAL